MIDQKTISLVIPVYNEAPQIENVLRSIPAFVDKIIIVNDGSIDDTENIIKKLIPEFGKSHLPIKEKKYPSKYKHINKIIAQETQKENQLFPKSNIYNTDESDKVILITLLKNTGVGAAVARGYKWSKDEGIDCVVKIDGDGQMDPEEIYKVCLPVVSEEVDYVKGNRLRHEHAHLIIPKARFIGNSILSILTKISSGYWKISDTQTAFTAISLKAINRIKLYDLYKKYGYPNDLLVKLNISLCKIKEVTIKPIYHVGEKSKMKVTKVAPKISILLIKGFFYRLYVKYLIKDFHPLFLFYNFSFLLFLLQAPYALKIGHAFLFSIVLSYETILAYILLFVACFQSLIFAMWMDMQDNERLYF